MQTSLYRKGEQIEKYYKIGDVLGEGSFAVVKKAIKKKSGQEFAVKMINKNQLSEDDSIALKNEVEILNQIDHPNAIKLTEIFEDENFIYLVIELMNGGELFDRIVEKEHYSEKEASDTIKPVIDCIAYCHDLGIVHRDLKPENLLYHSKDPNAILKISDFGLARFFDKALMTTACGTPGYVAPEIIIGKGYDSAVDYWSIGIIIYIMLCGFPPFYSESNSELFDLIKKGQFDFPSPYWDGISELAKDLIRKLLIVDPTKRFTGKTILTHPWILGEKTPRTVLPNVTNKIRDYNIKRKFKKAAMAALAAKKIEQLINK